MKLYEHQEQALIQAKNKRRVAFYHDMGLGKTFTGSAKMQQLNARVNLVVCQKSKVNDWVEHFLNNYTVIVFDLTKKNRIEGFLHWNDKQPDYIGVNMCVGVINYELAFRRPELLKLRDFTLLLDESSMIQNESAKRSKFALKLGDNASNVILLSGTPTGGKYENLWSQMHLLGWPISKKMYMNQYVEVEYLDTLGRSIPIVTGYKNVDRLKRKMAQYGCQFLKTDDVTTLPDQNFITVKVKATTQYKKFRKDSIVTVNDTELIGDTTLTKMLYERQLCGMYNANKLQAFKDLIESTNENIVVFYNFNEELRQLKQIAVDSDREYAVINGQDKSGLNYSQNYDYRCTPIKSEKPIILYCQYQAAAMGINLQDFSRRIIYYSLPLSSELFEQSKKRIHRIGTKDTCFYYLLICEKSIEEKIYKALQKRQDYTNRLFEKGG